MDARRRLRPALIHLWHLTTPVIAAVHGSVMGGDFWYSLAADITIADNAVFAQIDVRRRPGGLESRHRYGLTGDQLDAAEALSLGLVNEVVPLDQLIPKARALAERVARVPEPWCV